MRILRDGMVVSAIGPEGASIARVISLCFLFVFIFLQRFLLHKFSVNNILRYICFFFAVLISLINFKIIPNNSIYITIFPKLFNKLLNNTSVLLFYIISELFSVLIITNFWFLCNSILEKNNQNQEFYGKLFSFAQFGLIFASFLCIFFKLKSMWFIVISMLISVFCISFFPKTFINKEKQSVGFKYSKSILLIPLITIICAMIAGVFDNFVKFQLQKTCVDHVLYVQSVASVWFIQGICCMFLSFVLKFKFRIKRFATPLLGIFLFGFLFILKIFQIDQMIFVFCVSFGYILFKTLKYATHSPEKEDYIRHHEDMHSILLFEGFSGRFGKNIIAIFLSLIFSLGFKWGHIELPSLVFCGFLSIFWLYLSFFMKHR